MGGRGTAYWVGVAKRLKKMGSASDAKQFQDLKSYMSMNYGMRVSDDLQNSDFQSVKAAAQGLEDIIKDFPQAASLFHELNGNEHRKRAYASASYYGMVQLNPDKYTSRDVVERSYQSDLMSKWHPAGTTADSIPVHEAGHILERALIDKNLGHQSYAFMVNAWNKHSEATRVIGEACKVLKRTPEGRGLKNNDFVARVSGYARENRSETLAECVADYHANRENAAPLSREVWKILKRELG